MTPQSKALFEKPALSLLEIKSPVFTQKCRFIAVFKTADSQSLF
jgi:hypothetical protein